MRLLWVCGARMMDFGPPGQTGSSQGCRAEGLAREGITHFGTRLQGTRHHATGYQVPWWEAIWHQRPLVWKSMLLGTQNSDICVSLSTAKYS